MTQELYQKAMSFAGEKHSKQKVPSSEANYLLHLSNVAMEVLIAHSNDPVFDLDFALQIAILHDTIEDTLTSWEEIKEIFGKGIADAVQALTKDHSVSNKKAKMADCLNRINLLDMEVGIVKLADRITNLQRPPDHWNADKIQAYHAEAVIISQELSNKNEYLNNRLRKKIGYYAKYL